MSRNRKGAKPKKSKENNLENPKNIYYKFNFKFLELYVNKDNKLINDAHKALFDKLLFLSNDIITIIQGRGKKQAIEKMPLSSFKSPEKIKNKLKNIEEASSLYRNEIEIKDNSKVSIFRISMPDSLPSRVICYEKSGVIYLLYLDINGEAYEHGKY